MPAKHFRPCQHVSNPITIIILILLSFLIPIYYAKNDSKIFKACNKTITYACGASIRGQIEYPFWGNKIRSEDCGLGGYELSCDGNELVVDIDSNNKYRVVEIDVSAKVLQLNRKDNPLDSICDSSSSWNPQPIFKRELYDYGQKTEDLHLFYNCKDDTLKKLIKPNYTCPNEDDHRVYFFLENFLPQDLEFRSSCSYTKLPVNTTALEEFIKKPLQHQAQELFRGSFELYYNKTINQKACTECNKTGGLCWFGTNADSNDTCLYPQSGHKNLGLIIGTACAIVGGSILVLLLVIVYCSRMKIKHGSNILSPIVSSYSKDLEATITQYGLLIPKRFRYSTVKKLTNSFKDQIGTGGFGNVYRGTLADGRIVAVKVLKATKGNGEEFINEVASIGRTSHVNIVTLLGFCYEGDRRALIYEFMPNGSLEKFIHGTTPLLEGQHLGWEKLFSIAIGIARGLEYLHRGCNTRILHFDIKPHNILLDKDFHPKISDFGLAKLYNTNESAVSSLLQARGTIGYIAPEVASRNFGQVSHKSDVYSYGMMILEMVGGRKNVNAGADHTSEIYYPRWLYKRMQFDDVLNLGNEISAEENELARKMVIVGLWCIQIFPSQRPSISKVIEMLEGQTAALETPPNPYLCSVPSSPSNSHTKLVLSPPSGTEPSSST